MQYRSWQQQGCTTMGAWYPECKKHLSKKLVYEFKRKYKADHRRRWQRDVELELVDRENWVSQNAQ